MDKHETPGRVASPVQPIVSCDHTVTTGKLGEKGMWCCLCNQKIYDVEDRECMDCVHAKKLFDGWICKRHLMSILPSMKATFNVNDGTCFEARN